MPEGAHGGRSLLESIDSNLPSSNHNPEATSSTKAGSGAGARQYRSPCSRAARALCSSGLQSCTFWCTIAAPFGPPLGEREGEKMRWYNPTTRVAEIVLVPYTDEEATHMLWAPPTRGPS